MRMPIGRRAAGLFALSVLGAFALCWLTVLGHQLTAQEPQTKDADLDSELTPEEKFWFSTPRRRAASAAQMAVIRNPLAIAAMRVKAKQEMIWGDLEFAGEFAPALNADWLEEIKDGRPMPNIGGKEEKEIGRANQAMYNVYNQALIYSFEQPPDVFKKSARDNDFIKFPHVWNEPKLHRGKVIPLQGRIARIRKYEAPQPAQEKGVKFVHEGWVFSETEGAHPYAIIFPVLPNEFEVAEKMNRAVKFYGYFIGKIKVRAPKGDIDVPLLIGPTIYAERAKLTADDSTPFSLMVLIGLVGLLVGIAAVIFSISWVFRKGDRALQNQLAARNDLKIKELLENPEQWNGAAETNPQSQQGITSQSSDRFRETPS
jgi:hypothetical protein